MAYRNITLIRERKNPPDPRTPLIPLQCREIIESSPLEVNVESSPDRCYGDEEYSGKGVKVVTDPAGGELLLGVKEVPPDSLVPGKAYMFFSHTIKKQPANAPMFREILKKKITLIDYELLKDEKGNRVLAFGKWAGIVGAYNALLMYGKRTGEYHLDPAHVIGTFDKVSNILNESKFPPVKVFVAGTGNVGKGAEEVLETAGFTKLPIADFLNLEKPDRPVYSTGGTQDLYLKKDGKPFEKKEFYSSPELFKSNFKRFAASSEVFINAIFWDPRAPVLFSREEINSPEFRIRTIADVTCDINGSVPITTKTTSIQDPVIGVLPLNGEFTEPYTDGVIDLMAVPNLPAELPRDASRFFGRTFIEKILPEVLKEGKSRMLEEATIVKEGQIMPGFRYLDNYGKGN